MARDASYVRRGYRSFEHADFEARAGRVTALLSVEAAPVRDILLTIAGVVAPTAGSLRVCGCERAGRARLRAAFAPARGTRVGLGVVSGFAGQEPASTVGEALGRELALAGAASDAAAVLDCLARFGLATHVDQRVERLAPAARLRLSAALALAGSPRVAVVDASDAFCQGLSASDGAAVLRDLAPVVRAADAALVVGTCDARVARAADAAYPLDMDAAEALGAGAAGAPAYEE